MRRGGGRKSSLPSVVVDSEPKSALDEFAEQRGHVSFSGAISDKKKRTSRNQPSYLDLPSSSSSSSNDDDHDDGDDDNDDQDDESSGGEMEMIRVRALAGGSDDDDDDNDDGDDDDGQDGDDEMKMEKRPGMGWGKHKHVFYQQDEDEVSSSSGERLEEEEGRRLQAKKLQKMSEADFVDVPGRGKLPSDSKKKGNMEVAEKLLPAPDMDGGNNVELEALLRDVKAKVLEVRETLQPLLAWLRESKEAAEVAAADEGTQAGIAFVEMRYHLLLSYCTNLLFYTLLKTQNVPIKDHPVVEQLVRLRLMLDKTRGIDEKLQPQIKRLLKTAALGLEAVESDARHARANARAMLEEDLEDDDEQGEAAAAFEEAYVAPRRTVAVLDEEERHLDKKARKVERDKRRAQRSGIMAMVQEEFGEGPEVHRTRLQVLEDEEEERDAEQEQYERDNFIRLGKAQKKAGSVKFLDDLKSLDDFGDVARVLRQDQGGHSALSSMMSSQLRKRQGEFFEDVNDGDIDVNDDDGDEGGRDLEAEEAYERYVAETKAKKSAKKRSSYDADPNAHRNAVAVSLGDQEGKRGITYQMEANRGIKKGSKKEVARVRNKGKFKKAIMKRGTMVPSSRKESTRYSGEMSGINTKVVRSTKLK